MYNYLFGTPALPRKPSTTEHSDWFILGAYPSAIHVSWVPPGGDRVRAIAVADEPVPFWDGEDQQERVADWVVGLPWRSGWGQVLPADKYNGSSGSWLRDRVLEPLGIDREETWLTDCIDIYHESKGAAERLNDPSMQSVLSRLGIKDRHLRSHPSEDQIASAAQLDRLRQELTQCQPKSVITLGNAALRAFGSLTHEAIPIKKLAPDSSYGRTYEVQIPGGAAAELLPLAHPAAPDPYQKSHLNWLESR